MNQHHWYFILALDLSILPLHIIDSSSSFAKVFVKYRRKNRIADLAAESDDQALVDRRQCILICCCVRRTWAGAIRLARCSSLHWALTIVLLYQDALEEKRRHKWTYNCREKTMKLSSIFFMNADKDRMRWINLNISSRCSDLHFHRDYTIL